MDTEKVCLKCGRRCVPAQMYCPKCGSALPEATPAVASDRSGSHKLLLNKGVEEQVFEFENIEQAVLAAGPWIMKGYVARVVDQQGVVKYTQALAAGQVATYQGDATTLKSGTTSEPKGVNSSRRPWWKLW